MTMMINATVIRCSYPDDWCVDEARSRSRQTRRTEAATEYKGKKEGGLEGPVITVGYRCRHFMDFFISF
jgi:hypothetical protein